MREMSIALAFPFISIYLPNTLLVALPSSDCLPRATCHAFPPILNRLRTP